MAEEQEKNKKDGKNPVFSMALVAVLFFLGYLLVTLPGTFIEQYQAAKAHGPVWGYMYLGAVALGLLLLAGASSWAAWMVLKNTIEGRKRRRFSSAPASRIPDKEKVSIISRNIQEARRSAGSSGCAPDFSKAIEKSARTIEQKLEAGLLEIAVAGTVSSGKSTLLNTLVGRQVFETAASGGTTRQVRQIDFPGGDRVRLVDLPGLAEADGIDREEEARQAAASADLVLFVIDGPLKDFEFTAIKDLAAMEKRVIVCLNKQDWFSPEDQEILLGRLRQQLEGLVNQEDIVAVQAAEVRREITRVSPDGTEREDFEEIAPDVSALVERMTGIIKGHRRDLLLCNLLLQSRMLKKDTEERLRKMLVSRARRVVDSYTWKSALAAAASPTPILDVAAGLGFSLKMILDIASVFEIKIEISDARQLLNQLMKNLYASLGASALAPAVAQIVASAIKGIPVAGTLSGGALQGVVQAVVTRWIGTVMVEYFQERKSRETGSDLQSLAMEKWKEATSASQLASLAVEGLRRFERAGRKGKIGSQGS